VAIWVYLRFWGASTLLAVEGVLQRVRGWAALDYAQL
jgi:hypothetical protein